MALNRIEKVLNSELDALEHKGLLKRAESVITAVLQPKANRGPRYLIEGYGNKEFIRMNANNYLGLSVKKELSEAEEKSAERFGIGPGSVRFISGTFKPHVDLEKKLAQFHGRESGMLFSSAYDAMIGMLFSLISQDTIVISDELNHNCIINAIRMSRPKDKKIYSHNNMAELESALSECRGQAKRVIIVTDGIFSMRGDYAPLPDIAHLAERYDCEFEEGALTIVDDSHGVAAFGTTGRGTMEITQEYRIDVLVATLGKAFGVNGGYLVSDEAMVRYLREKAPTYIYSNPISAPEASASLIALEIVDSARGEKLLAHLSELTAYFRKGLLNLGYEVIQGVHPIVPLVLRDTQKTVALVKHLKENGVLATGLNYPVVPRGDDEIRFQVCADQSFADLDSVLEILGNFRISRN